jgi:hypothetical protein
MFVYTVCTPAPYPKPDSTPETGTIHKGGGTIPQSGNHKHVQTHQKKPRVSALFGTTTRMDVTREDDTSTNMEQ